jgi:predicted nicotinamide N-methyase
MKFRSLKSPFSINNDADGSKLPIHISEKEGVKAENLSLATWGSSYVLANHLHRWKSTDSVQTARENASNSVPVLELGAGTGLVGLSAAAIWQLPVILTDLAPIVPGLAQNINMNRALLAEKETSATCGCLDWTNPKQLLLCNPVLADTEPKYIQSTRKAHMILAADVVYSEEHPELLLKTILEWLTPGPDARVVICYPVRIAYIDHIRDLWERFEGAGLVCVEEAQESSDDDWGEAEPAPYEFCMWAWKGEQNS